MAVLISALALFDLVIHILCNLLVVASFAINNFGAIGGVRGFNFFPAFRAFAVEKLNWISLGEPREMAAVWAELRNWNTHSFVKI